LKKPPSKVLDGLGKEIRKTGSGLIKAPSEEIAEAWSAWFKDSMPGHYGVLVVRGKEVNIYTTFEGFPEEPGRLPEKEIMRIAGMKKKPFPWWKNNQKNTKGPNLGKGGSLESLKKKGIFGK